MKNTFLFRVLVVSLCFLQSFSGFAVPVIFSGSDVKTLRQNIDLNGVGKILSGTTDPTVSATAGPTGAIYLNTSNGNLYRHLDSSNDTNWSTVGSGSSGKNYISNPTIDGNTNGYSTYAESDAVTFTDAGDTVNLNAHGLQNGNTVSFTSITSTTGISINTLYYVVGATANTFQVASTSGGAALALTTNGSGTLVRSYPKTGSGGSPNVTISRTTTNPLSGTGSLLISKDAANRMGQGVSIPFTIDRADLGSQEQVKFDFEVAAGTFAAGVSPIGGATAVDSDLEVYVYDVTNATLIQLSNFRILQNSGQGHFSGTFQAASNSTSYRLIAHCATVSALAFDFKVDSVSVAPQATTTGPPVTDWKTYTPIWSALSINPAIGNGTLSGQYRRVGDSIQIQVSMLAGSTTNFGTGIWYFSLPLGLTIDTTKIALNATNQQAFGTAWGNGGGASNFSGTVVLGNSSSVVGIQPAGGANMWQSSSPGTWASTNSMSFIATIPAVGWASNVAMSSDQDGRMIGFEANTATATITGSASDVSWTKVRDDIGTFNGTTTWTATTPGWYYVDAAIRVDATYAAGNDSDLFLVVSGSTKYTAFDRASGAQVSMQPHFSKSVYLNAGDTLKFQVSSAGTTPTSASASTFSWWTIAKWPGSGILGAADTVAAKYYASVNTTSTTATPINYDTKVYDTTGAVTTGAGWKFTAPIAGKYLVSTFNNSASGTNNTFLALYKNGSKYEDLSFSTNVATNLLFGATQVPLLAGDFIDLRCTTSTVISGNATQSNDVASHIDIMRVGN